MRTSQIEEVLSHPSFHIDPHPVYHRLRQHAPVYWSEAEGQWLVTSFDLVDEMLSRPEDFSSVGFEQRRIHQLAGPVRARAARVEEHFAAPQLVSSDPPDHTRLRRAFGRVFLPRRVAGLSPVIRELADRLLAGKREGTLDVIGDYAEPLPVEVVSEIVGVPPSHRGRIPAVTLDQREFFGVRQLTADHAERFSATLGEWHGLLIGWMDDRRSDPADDVLTVAAGMVDESRITVDEAVATLLHLVIAGNGTTTALIGSVVYHLLRDPERAARVTADRSLLANAVEETLRFETPLPKDRRIAVRHCRLGDSEIRRGDLVMAVLAAANRDPDQFPDPDRFDLDRSFSERHHVAFGRGIHLCLGAAVARLETVIALDALLDHRVQPRLDPGFEPVWHAVHTHRGLVALPLRGGAA